MLTISQRQRYPRFKLGETVTFTDLALAERPHLRGRARVLDGRTRGEVVKLEGRLGVTVRWAGQRGSHRYWAGFLRHLRSGE